LEIAHQGHHAILERVRQGESNEGPDAVTHLTRDSRLSHAGSVRSSSPC
jgi:hypothetical protein